MIPPPSQDNIPKVYNDLSLNEFSVKQPKECPRCQGKDVFVIDKKRKSYWCRECCGSFEKNKK